MNFQLHQQMRCSAKYVRQPSNMTKTFFVESHRNSAKHKFGLSSTHKAEQTFLQNATADDFTENVITAFLSADIPLIKLQNEKIMELFVKMGKGYHRKVLLEKN